MPDDLSMEVGRLDGRLTALESRADRFEAAVSTKLEAMDKKLDGIAESLATRDGTLSGLSGVARWAAALVMLAGSVEAYEPIKKLLHF